MSKAEFDHLVRAGQLAHEAFERSEFDGLLRSGRARLKDARSAVLSIESRFDLAYNAAHALAHAALRWHGYRAHSRYLVFQVLPLTTGVPSSVWRTLAKCHSIRNEAEYEGALEMDDRLVLALLSATESVEQAVNAMTRGRQ